MKMTSKMEMEKIMNKILLYFSLCIFSTGIFALGLATDFNNILIENLQIGQEYNLTKLANLPLKVKNISERTVKLEIQPVYPVEQSLRDGFEIIPSTDWIKLSKTRFTVAPGDYAVSDVIITIPEDKKYLGKKFQVNIWSYISSVEGGSGFIAVTPGVEGALLFSIAPVEINEKIKSVDLSFELNPMELYAVVSSTYTSIGTVEIKNISKKTKKYEIGQINPKDVDVSLYIKEGYEALPEDLILSVSPNRLKIKKKSSKMFNIFLTVPEDRNYSGKKFFGLVKVKTHGKGVTGSKFIKVYVEFK